MRSYPLRAVLVDTVPRLLSYRRSDRGHPAKFLIDNDGAFKASCFADKGGRRCRRSGGRLRWSRVVITSAPEVICRKMQANQNWTCGYPPRSTDPLTAFWAYLSRNRLHVRKGRRLIKERGTLRPCSTFSIRPEAAPASAYSPSNTCRAEAITWARGRSIND